MAEDEYNADLWHVSTRGGFVVTYDVFLNHYYREGGFDSTDLYERNDPIERGRFEGVAPGGRHVREEGFVEPVTVRTEALERFGEDAAPEVRR